MMRAAWTPLGICSKEAAGQGRVPIHNPERIAAGDLPLTAASWPDSLRAV